VEEAGRPEAVRSWRRPGDQRQRARGGGREAGSRLVVVKEEGRAGGVVRQWVRKNRRRRGDFLR
jgi:hypothetical protein